MNPPQSSQRNFFRPTWAEISLPAFVSNLKTIQKIVGPSVKLLAVLKADAYGHGAETLAPLAVENNVFSIGVSSLEEGIVLRDEGIKSPILILGGLFPLENFSAAVEHHLTPTVSSLEAAQALKRTAQKFEKAVSFHLKIDTGMSRIGVSPSGAKRVLEWVAREPLLKMEGIYSHLSCAETDPSFSQEQLRQFEYVVSVAKNLGLNQTLAHIANSAAIMTGRSYDQNLVRPGLALYGVVTTALPEGAQLTPVLTWHTKVIFLKKVPAQTPISYAATYRTRRPSQIATLPVGYADGLPRRTSNKGFVLISGKRCPIVGRVTMDHTMVDVTGMKINVGEPVVIIGQQGKESLTATDWADWAETSSYEILCGISKRVPRITIPGNWKE